jgi:hypothetical protein
MIITKRSLSITLFFANTILKYTHYVIRNKRIYRDNNHTIATLTNTLSTILVTSALYRLRTTIEHCLTAFAYRCEGSTATRALPGERFTFASSDFHFT